MVSSRSALRPAIVLFVFNRPDCTRLIIEQLRREPIPHLLIFCDGPRDGSDDADVAEVRSVVESIDFCPTTIVSRAKNVGLGYNVFDGIARAFRDFDAVVVLEDDLQLSEGTIDFLLQSLRCYASQEVVCSISAWNHPRVTPARICGPLFATRRAELLCWATWRECWLNMEVSALRKLMLALGQGGSMQLFGWDVLLHSLFEKPLNIWTYRWLLEHFLQGGLNVRPLHSLVEHTWNHPKATNAGDSGGWHQDDPIPARVPKFSSREYEVATLEAELELHLRIFHPPSISDWICVTRTAFQRAIKRMRIAMR